MNYAKPEVTLLGNVVSAIQDPSEKSGPVMEVDPSNPYLASINAYAADE
jgi:hypothetical protein